MRARPDHRDPRTAEQLEATVYVKHRRGLRKHTQRVRGVRLIDLEFSRWRHRTPTFALLGPPLTVWKVGSGDQHNVNLSRPTPVVHRMVGLKAAGEVFHKLSRVSATPFPFQDP
jgi:hypothetical protein